MAGLSDITVSPPLRLVRLRIYCVLVTKRECYNSFPGGRKQISHENIVWETVAGTQDRLISLITILGQGPADKEGSADDQGIEDV